MGDIFHSSTMFNDPLNNISNLVMTLQGQINKLRYSSIEMERRCTDLRVLIRSELEAEKSEELLQVQEVSDNSKMCIVEDFSDKIASLVLDEMPQCLPNAFAAPQIGQKPDKLEFEHSTAAAILTIESADMSDAIIISSGLKSGLDENKTEEADFMTENLDSQPFVIVTGDTKPEIERHDALSIASIYTHLGKSGVASSLFDEIPENSGPYRYTLISKNDAAQHMLLQFPFDPGSAGGLVFDNVALVFDNSLQFPISTNDFRENPRVPIAGQVFDTMSQPTVDFGENPVAAIVDPSLIYAMEFEDAFNLPLFIYSSYNPSTLVYHCIPKFNAMALIFSASNANANAITTLRDAAVQAKLEMTFALSVSHKIPEFLQMNPIGQVPLLDTLDSNVFERTAIPCYVTLWHHQSVPTCLHIESDIALVENVGHCTHRNCSNIHETLIDLNLENLWDTDLHQLCSILEALFMGLRLVHAIPLWLIHNYTCISLAHAFCSFLREELKFSNHLIAQVRGSQFAKVVFAKRINTHVMLMKLVTAFKELVKVWCDNLQVTWLGFCSLGLIIHNMVIGVYVLHNWLNRKKRFFSALIAHEIMTVLARALIVKDFAVHAFENDSWSLSTTESEISVFAIEDKLVLPCMLSLGLARHSHEFGTRWNTESYALMLHVVSSKSSFFPTGGFGFFLIVTIPIALGFSNSKESSSICWINWFRFQPTIIPASFQPFHFAFATEEIAVYTIKRDLTDPDTSVEYEFWANSAVECGSDCENQQPFVKNFKRASQALEQNHLTPYSIIWYCPEAFILHTWSKSVNVTSCRGTFCRSLCEFSMVLRLIFVGKGCTQCEASGILRGGCWKGTTECRTYSIDIDDNKNRWDCYLLVTESVCLVLEDDNDISALHNLVVLVPKSELEGEVDDVHKAVLASVMSHALRKMSNSLSLSHTILIIIKHVTPKLSTLTGFGRPYEVTGTRNSLVQPLVATLLHWLVDKMNRDLDLAIKTSGRNFILDANTGRDEQDKTMIFELLYSNLEDKVLFEGRSIVMNMVTMKDPLGSLANYVWDLG